MPLSLSSGVAIVADQVFQYRVAMGFYYQARIVLTEATTVAAHEQRERFARSILGQPHTAFLQYAAMVVTDQAIIDAGPANQAAISDGQIITAIASMWNTLAGVRA